MAGRRPRVEYIFLVIGLALVAGAVAIYEITVRRPQTWPQTDAEVLSSHVVNPTGPNKYSPQLVFRYATGGRVLERTIVPRWSSSSYDMVRSYVDAYPAGRHVTVAVNPADPEDIRHELGATLMNLLLPGVFATLGLVFVGIGVVATRANPWRQSAAVTARPEHGARPSANSFRTARRIGMTFAAIGLVIAGIGAVMVRADLAVRREWPPIEATVVASRVIATGRSSSSGGQPSRLLYDTQVTFRYVVDGVGYQNTTSTGVSTSSRSGAEARAAEYAPATVHVINVRPDDPNIIRFDLDSTFRLFFLSGGIVVMGLVFLGLGGAVWRFARGPRPPATIPDIGTEDRFRPRE